tara:strand:+ start:2027 stop:2650 length:624 start_codon:yes stop_codon:yes gene_type:complete
MSFKKNKYKILRKAISLEKASFIYRYFLNKEKVAKILFDAKYISPYDKDWGDFKDPQVPNCFSSYSDIVMETLLQELLKKMESQTKLKLYPTYSFARIYKKGNILDRHKDRYSCEVSTTLNLGGESWPIYLDPTGKEGQAGIKVDLEPGDMLIYSGCDLEHWREPFKGKNCAQVFLHYNNVKAKYAKKNMFDGREMLGLPPYFKKKN